MRARSLVVVVGLLVAATALAQSWPVGGGGGGGPWTVYIPTSGDLDVSDHYHPATCERALVSNGAAGQAVTVVLCDPATVGSEVVVVVEDATQDVTIEPGNDARIATPEVDALGDGLDLDCDPVACTVGSHVHLVATSATEWRVLGSKGSVAVDNNSGPADMDVP
jgi:hypothetical protein